jgi:hypothetical protein
MMELQNLNSFSHQHGMTYTRSVKSSDLTIDETDQKVAAAEYQVLTPLVGNVSIVMKFKVTTEH